MINTNTYNLYCFIVLAQQLNYTKASSILNLSQPALSKIIRTLEKQLGYDLFYRNTHQVLLTDAGQLFFHRMLAVLGELDRGVFDAKAVSCGHTNVLRVGFLPYAYFYELPFIVSAYEKRFPETHLILSDFEEADLKSALINDQIDVALASNWGDFFLNDLEVFDLCRYDYCAVVSNEHVLSKCSSVHLAMLQSEKILTLTQKGLLYEKNNYEKQRMLDLIMNNGFLPDLLSTIPTNTFAGLLGLVACNKGVAILSSHIHKIITENAPIKFIPIQDIDMQFRTRLYFKMTNKNSQINQFTDFVKTYFSQPTMHTSYQ